MSGFQRKFSMESYRRESALKVTRRNATKTHSKPLRPMGSWKQTAQERSKWRGLINKVAALYDEKRNCEAERKHREHKDKTYGPPADSMKLTFLLATDSFELELA